MYTVCTQINESLRRHFADLEKATKYSVSDIGAELFSKGLISEAVKDSPTYDKIFNEFKAGIRLMSNISELANRYETFLQCLSCNGGPSQDAFDKLIADWNNIKKQFQEGK